MKKFENIKSITGKVKFHGKGFVNGDSADVQKPALEAKGFLKRNDYKCISLHMKNFVKVDGEEKFVYKVTARCIRNNMYGLEMCQFNEGMTAVPTALMNAIATPEMVGRGMMFTNDCIPKELMPKAFRKKSTFGVSESTSTDYEDMAVLEMGTRMGHKYGKTASDDVDSVKGGKSAFFIENVGEHDYESDLRLDLTECQFFSLDEIYDRGAVFFTSKTLEEIFFNSLKRNFKVDYVPSIKKYYIPGSTNEEFAEEGLLFTPEMVDIVVKDVLRRLASVYIYRGATGGQFKFIEMNLTINFADGSEENITITKPSDVDEYFFGYEQKYFEANQEAINNREALYNYMVERESKKVEKSSTGKGRGKGKKNTTEEKEEVEE